MADANKVRSSSLKRKKFVFFWDLFFCGYQGFLFCITLTFSQWKVTIYPPQETCFWPTWYLKYPKMVDFNFDNTYLSIDASLHNLSPSMNVFSIKVNLFYLLRFGLFGRENSNVNGTFWVIFTRCREHMRLCIKCISKVSAVVKFMAAWVLVFQTCCCASLCAQHCVALRDHASKLCKVGSYLKMFLAWRCFYYSLGCREVRPVIRVPTCTRSHFPGAALQNHTGTEA